MSRTEDLLQSAPYSGLLRLPKDTRAHGTVVFAHGFALSPRLYSDLATQWAKVGWAVYVPTLYNVCTPVGEEVEAFGSACTWAFASLPRPLILAGHSRGGQAVLMYLLGIYHGDNHQRARMAGLPPLAAYRGVLLLDPCEGAPRSIFGCGGLKHMILNCSGIDWKWSDIPVAIVQNRGCVPEGHDGRALYSGLRAATLVGGGNWEFGDAPFYLVNAKRFGHLDYLDDATGLVAAVAAMLIHGDRAKRALLRRYTADLLTALFHPGANRRDVRARVAEVERRIRNA